MRWPWQRLRPLRVYLRGEYHVMPAAKSSTQSTLSRTVAALEHFREDASIAKRMIKQLRHEERQRALAELRRLQLENS